MARPNYSVDHRCFIFTLIVYDTQFSFGYLLLLALSLASHTVILKMSSSIHDMAGSALFS